MAAQLHPVADSILFFNFTHTQGENKGNIDVIRTVRPHKNDEFEAYK